MTNNSATNHKAIALISYLWLPGWVVALILHNNNRSSLAAFHLRQSLGLLVLGVAVWVINLAFALLEISLISWLLSLGLLLLWVLGFLSAFQGVQRAIPLIGEQFQHWFGEVIRDN